MLAVRSLIIREQKGDTHWGLPNNASPTFTKNYKKTSRSESLITDLWSEQQQGGS